MMTAAGMVRHCSTKIGPTSRRATGNERRFDVAQGAPSIVEGRPAAVSRVTTPPVASRTPFHFSQLRLGEDG
jgi:hypothetical protein